MPNYKSYVGVDQVYYAEVTQDDASAYSAGATAYLAPIMNVALAPKSTSKTQYADNQPFDVMTSEGETEMDLEITGLPLDVQAAILGKVYDVATGRMFDNGGTPPFLALGFRAKKSDGEFRYYWFLKGMFQSPPEDIATQADAPDPKSVKLKFTAIRTVYQFDLGDINDSVKRVIGDTSDVVFNETSWFASVQVPVAGAPAAITCTPIPADSVTGQLVSMNITLTFNNALAAGSENGIVLTTVAGAIKACARTIDVTRKIVTLDPSTNMAGATQYLIIVPGVVDIYGQTLADAVYDFTTA